MSLEETPVHTSPGSTASSATDAATSSTTTPAETGAASPAKAAAGAEARKPLTEEQGKVLVKLARDAIATALGKPATPDPQGEWLKQLGATFVTITRHGELHGCIGSLEARQSIVADVKHNAVAAALYDPRAGMLTLEQVEDLRIEVSLLSPLEPIAFDDEVDALSKIRPHVDGVVLAHGTRRATFLPQVWRSLPAPAEFMEQLKRKAGLAPSFWAPTLKLYRYSLEKFSEETPS